MRQKQLAWNEKLPSLFITRRQSFGEKKWTTWANYLRKLKIKQVWIEEGLYADGQIQNFADIVNSAKKKYIYVIGSRRCINKRWRGNAFQHRRKVNVIEVLLIPPKLAQKILVLGGLP